MEKKELKSGRFSKKEQKFIKDNYRVMSDREIADTLNRELISIRNFRQKRKLTTVQGDKKNFDKTKDSYVLSLDDNQKRAHFEKEVKSSAMFRSLQKSLTKEELDYYVEQYVDFMMDPTIETMTAAECDMVHQKIIAEVRIHRYLDEEKRKKDISRAKEIEGCQAIIMKCQQSLNVERRQRLKDQSDQAVTFTNLIRDLKNPVVRNTTGREAAMLKFIAEKFYNDTLGKNIISGKEKKFDLNPIFKKQVPTELSSNFTSVDGETSDEKDSPNNN
jgi:hypothetical protein